MSIDLLVARAQEALAASMRDAYHAGRSEAAVTLKSKVLTLFEELLGPTAPAEAAPPAAEEPIVAEKPAEAPVAAEAPVEAAPVVEVAPAASEAPVELVVEAAVGLPPSLTVGGASLTGSGLGWQTQPGGHRLSISRRQGRIRPSA